MSFYVYSTNLLNVDRKVRAINNIHIVQYKFEGQVIGKAITTLTPTQKILTLYLSQNVNFFGLNNVGTCIWI